MRFPPYYVVAVFYNFSSHLQPMDQFYAAMSALIYMSKFARDEITSSETKTFMDYVVDLPVVAASFDKDLYEAVT